MKLYGICKVKGYCVSECGLCKAISTRLDFYHDREGRNPVFYPSHPEPETKGLRVMNTTKWDGYKWINHGSTN